MPRLLSVIAAVAVAAVLAGTAAGSGRPKRPAAPVVVQTSDGGFAWDDAAIGAAAALGLVLALSGALFLKGDRK